MGIAYKRTRAKHGYKSKSRGRSIRGKAPVPANSWSLVVHRNCPPFEDVVPLELPDDPVTYLRYEYPAPPFLLEKNPAIRNSAGPRLYHPQSLKFMGDKIAELQRDPHVVDVQTQSPHFRIDAVARLSAKIACGAFFLADPHSLFASDLGEYVTEGGNNVTLRRLAFSASNADFQMEKRELRVFSVNEDGLATLYCAVRLIHEAFDQNYFIRIPKVSQPELQQVSWDYATS